MAIRHKQPSTRKRGGAITKRPQQKMLTQIQRDSSKAFGILSQSLGRPPTSSELANRVASINRNRKTN